MAKKLSPGSVRASSTEPCWTPGKGLVWGAYQKEIRNATSEKILFQQLGGRDTDAHMLKAMLSKKRLKNRDLL